MTRRLAILSPDPGDDLFTRRVLPPVEGYQKLFAQLGVEVVPHPWVEPPPTGVDGVLACLAWGYHFRLEDWEALLTGWDPSVPLVNGPDILLWNTRKTYLLELANRGVRIVPTLTPDISTADVVEQAFVTFGTDRIVIKPLVSAGSNDTYLISRGDPLPTPMAGRMIQPFLSQVAEEGELSLFFFGGQFSHAVAKVAAAGDFRVQPQFGGQFRHFEPDSEAIGLAQAVLKAAPAGLVYARIDMVRDDRGVLSLMELEAIEPDLYFDFAHRGGLAFGEAVLEHLSNLS